jgi:putative ABC transport system substrate-binding protein
MSLSRGGNAVLAAKRATSVIPIVFGLALDPIGSGMIASLSHPGGNVTGMSLQSPDLAGKRLEIVREVLPRLRRMAILANAVYAAAMLEMAQAEAAARKLGITAVKLEVRQANDLAPALASFKGGELLYVCTDALIGTNDSRLVTGRRDRRPDGLCAERRGHVHACCRLGRQDP